jgi:excisionase family DNA binding protein
MEQSIENRVSKLEQSLFMVKNILSFGEASQFLSLSKSYLYKLTSSGQIPHYKPQGKMLYFEKTELENWLRQNPVKTNQQILKESELQLINRKRCKFVTE